MFLLKGDKIVFDAIFKGVRTLGDGSVSITLHTQELPEHDDLIGGKLLSLNQKFVNVLIKKTDADTSDLDDLDEFKPERFDIPKDKSPAKRLRDILFIRYKSKGMPGGDFDLWYKNRVDQYIAHEKTLIVDKHETGE